MVTDFGEHERRRHKLLKGPPAGAVLPEEMFWILTTQLQSPFSWVLGNILKNLIGFRQLIACVAGGSDAARLLTNLRRLVS